VRSQHTEIGGVVVGIVVVNHAPLVKSLLDVVVRALGVEIGRPREVYQRKMGVAELLVNLQTDTTTELRISQPDK